MKVKKIDRLFEAFRLLVSILIAFGIALAIISLLSDTPMESVRNFIVGPWESKQRISNILEQMVPYLFTGTAICVMYQANLFNLAGEGVFFITGAISAFLAINFSLPPGINQIAIILVSAIIGGFIMWIPAYLKVKWNANEAVSSIMINYILLYLGRYILLNFMRDPSAIYNMSYQFGVNGRLPNLMQGTRLHFGIIIGLVVVLVAFIFLYKSKKGYEIRVTGQNQNFARYSGISTNKSLLLASIIGGLIVGIGGSTEMMGMYQRFRWEDLPGYGWDGVLVGTLARNNPILVPIASFFLAYLRIGADIVARTSDLPVEFISVIQAIVIMLVGAQMFMASFKHKIIAKSTKVESDGELA